MGVGTGRRMAQPEADRRPLRLRAMPPGRLRRKRRNPHHAGCHNNRAGPCGRVRRLRGAVVGGTFGGSIDGCATWWTRRLIGADSETARWYEGKGIDGTGTVKLSRIRPFCGRILLKLRPGINDLEVVEGDENATKQLNLTLPKHEEKQPARCSRACQLPEMESLVTCRWAATAAIPTQPSSAAIFDRPLSKGN